MTKTNQANTWERVHGLLVRELGLDEDVITPEAVFVDLGMDSLDAVEVIMAVEEEFGIEISNDQAEKAERVSDLLVLIDQLTKE